MTSILEDIKSKYPELINNIKDDAIATCIDSAELHVDSLQAPAKVQRKLVELYTCHLINVSTSPSNQPTGGSFGPFKVSFSANASKSDKFLNLFSQLCDDYNLGGPVVKFY